MADWISLEEAVAIITAQTGITAPHSALRGAMERGALTSDYDRVALDIEDINRAELLRWIGTLKAPVPAGRPAGSGKQTTDGVLVKRMKELLGQKKANSPADAVKQICKEDGKLYGASLEATIKRLRNLYNASGD